MKKKVTSTDIAKAAGVSQATVSMVLNKKYNVSFSKETVEKVEQAAREQASMATANRAARMRFFMIHSSFSCFDLAYFRSVRCSYARFSSPCHVIVKWNR